MIVIYFIVALLGIFGAYGTMLTKNANNWGIFSIIFSGTMTAVLWVYVSKNYNDLTIKCMMWDAIYALVYTFGIYFFVNDKVNEYQFIGITMILIGMMFLNWK